MATLPQLIDEDVQQLERILSGLLLSSEATTALLIDKGGFLIHQVGDGQFDVTTIAALAAGAYLANQSIAGLIQEDNFNSVYQQGEKFSLFVLNVDQYTLLVLIFGAGVSCGAVKYFALRAATSIATQLQQALARDPGAGFDLSALNVADTAPLFRKKTA